MINEDKIRKACSSDRERGFRLLVDSFQEPIYNYIPVSYTHLTLPTIA